MDKFIRSFDKTRIFYIYTPGINPFTLVFLHGVGANLTVWKNELNYFQKKGFSTLALDLRGHGNSDAPHSFDRYQLPCFSRDLHLILKQERITDFSLIGHSLGGGIIIHYCMRYKRLFPSSLILIESASTYPFDHNRLLNLNPYVTNLLRFISEHEATRRHHLPHLQEIYLSVKGIEKGLHVISHLLHLTPLECLVKTLDNVEQFVFHNQQRINTALHGLHIPILIVAGSLDRIIPLKFSDQIKALNRKAQLRILPGAEHRVIINHPRKVSHVVYEFLTKQHLSSS